MNWSDTARSLASIFIDVAIPPLFALLLLWLRRHNMNTALVEAVGRAAGVAYLDLAQRGASITDQRAVLGAINVGSKYLADHMAETLAASGCSPAAVQQMLAGELGKLAAVDPTVNVGGAQTPAIVAPRAGPGPAALTR